MLNKEKMEQNSQETNAVLKELKAKTEKYVGDVKAGIFTVISQVKNEVKTLNLEVKQINRRVKVNTRQLNTHGTQCIEIYF